MNKKLTQRLLATFAIAMFFVGANAQVHQNLIVKSDEYSGDSAVTVQITEGKTLPVWVMPDTYYHPNWNAHNNAAAGNHELTDGFTWVFTPSNANITLAGQADNYVQVTAAGAVGTTSTLEAYEVAPAAYGGCDNSGNPSGIDFEIVAIPSITAPATTYYKICDGTAGPANITATLASTDTIDLEWDIRVYNTTTADTTTATETYDNTLTAAGNTTTFFLQETKASPQRVITNGAFDVMADGATAVAQGDFIVRGGERTVYEFVLRNLNDKVSRKSDFLSLVGTATGSITRDQFVYYDVNGAAADTDNITVQVVVLPAPATGPIYHIPSNWAQ